jgi:hypothetical protein
MMWEWQVRSRIGSYGLIVEADPSKIAGRIIDWRRRKTWKTLNSLPVLPGFAKSGINRGLREMRRFDLTKDGYYDFVSIESGNTYRKLKDVLDHSDTPEASETYQHILREFRARGTYRHKKFVVGTEADVAKLVRACYSDLLSSMAKDGYVSEKTSTYATGGTGLAMIWKDGKLWHEDGATHRLSTARLVGVQRGFPLRIVGVHRDFLRAQGIRGTPDLSRLPEALADADGVLSTQIMPGTVRD